ncbi:MAG: helix-turn-helix domain-containing protein [Nocardioidaceae bacterium]
MTDPEQQAARETAEPITALIADRVREFRARADLSQQGLADQMAARGIPWKRPTVVNLEKRGTASTKRSSGVGRDAVTVQELLTLAVVLDVPPTALLADPQSDTPVPIAGQVEMDPARALMWLIGLLPLTTSPSQEWRDAATAVDVLRRLFLALRNYETSRYLWETRGDDMAGGTREENERNKLSAILGELETLGHVGLPIPPLPDHVRDGVARLLEQHAAECIASFQGLRELEQTDARHAAAASTERRWLLDLRQIMRRMAEWDLGRLPVVPPDVVAAAQEQGLDLSGIYPTGSGGAQLGALSSTAEVFPPTLTVGPAPRDDDQQ